jgi:hypothetical protein
MTIAALHTRPALLCVCVKMYVSIMLLQEHGPMHTKSRFSECAHVYAVLQYQNETTHPPREGRPVNYRRRFRPVPPLFADWSEALGRENTSATLTEASLTLEQSSDNCECL